MSRKLDGKVTVVTGASKGIGASIALHLAAEGAAVVVNYGSSKEGAGRRIPGVGRSGVDHQRDAPHYRRVSVVRVASPDASTPLPGRESAGLHAG